MVEARLRVPGRVRIANAMEHEMVHGVQMHGGIVCYLVCSGRATTNFTPCAPSRAHGCPAFVQWRTQAWWTAFSWQSAARHYLPLPPLVPCCGLSLHWSVLQPTLW